MKVNIFFTIFLCIVLTVVFSAKALCFPIKAKDDLDREVELIETPQKIASLAPTITDILVELGLKDRVVGMTKHCDCPYTKGTEGAAIIGGFANPDVSKVIALEPDLIIAFGTVQLHTVEELERKGEKVFWIYPRSVQEILNSFERIGEITGSILPAQKLKEKIEAKIQRVTEKLTDISEEDRPVLLRAMGLTPPATVGGKSFKTDVFRMAGGKNIFEDADKDYFEFDIDVFNSRAPDVIILSTNDLAHSQERKEKLKSQEVWKDLEAVKNDKILVLPSDIICRPGPQVAESIERIARYLYPKRFSSDN